MHFGSQNGIKIDPKMRSKFKIEQIASWDRLGSTLGRLGGVRGAFLLIFYRFLYYFVEIHVFDVKTLPRRFGDEIWPKMTPSWSPKTTPNRSKIRGRKLINILFDFWIDLGAILSRFQMGGYQVRRQRRGPYQVITFGNYHRFRRNRTDYIL